MTVSLRLTHVPPVCSWVVVEAAVDVMSGSGVLWSVQQLPSDPHSPAWDDWPSAGGPHHSPGADYRGGNLYNPMILNWTEMFD